MFGSYNEAIKILNGILEKIEGRLSSEGYEDIRNHEKNLAQMGAIVQAIKAIEAANEYEDRIFAEYSRVESEKLYEEENI